VFSKRIKIKSLVCRNLGVLYSMCEVPKKKRFCNITFLQENAVSQTDRTK
jgi:hypothetical protein